MTTKEDVRNSLTRFVKEFGKYPTRQDTRDYDYLYSQQTVNRYLGLQSELGILEEVYEENPKRCLCCNSIIPFSKRNSNIYCSHSCSAKSTNAKRAESLKEHNLKLKANEITPFVREYHYCLKCETPINSKTKKKFCSLDCSAKHRQMQRLDEWLLGKRPNICNPSIRNYLIELEGNKCSVCGIENWNDRPIVLEVEHKDGNSGDSSKDNVCLICPNCHSQTDTYKGKNKGKGRHKRMERYYDGKSY